MNQALGVLAFQTKIPDLHKHLDDSEIEKIREIAHLMKPSDAIELPATRTRAQTHQPKMVKMIIGEDLQLTDPLLSDQVIRDAKAMTKLYALMYVFENSVREVIIRRLSQKYGDNWWDIFYSSNAKIANIRKNAKGLMQSESQNAWHGRRGNHPIYYTDLPDLRTIIEVGWSDFHYLFPKLNWVVTRIEELSMSRNVIDHHNPLQPDDQKRVMMYCTDWHKQIDSKKHDLS